MASLGTGSGRGNEEKEGQMGRNAGLIVDSWAHEKQGLKALLGHGKERSSGSI